MNKKVLSAILFSALFAGTGTFTSCIDNEEPAGIEELRGAKAELLRAKVAVEQAKATFTLAQAEVEKAKAAKELAEAKIKEATAKLEEAKAEAQEIKNEEARVELETLIAKYEMELEKAAADHELSMVKKQQALAEAKRSYDIAMKQIAIAEALMSESQKVAVSTIKAQINTLMGQVDMVEDAIEAKQEELYHAALYLGAETDYQVATAEKALAVAEASLEANAEAIAKFKGYIESEDAETADWRAEIAAIEAEEAKYDKQIAVLKLEATKKQESEECKELQAAVVAATAAKEAIKAPVLAAEMKYAYMYFEGSKEVVTKLAKGETQAKAIELIAAENAVIDALKGELATYTTEKQYWLDSIADMAGTAATKAEKNAADLKKAWNDAKTAYVTAKATAKDIKFDVPQAAYKAYKEALAAAELLVGSTADQTLAKIAAAQVKAKQNFADALVAYYNTLPVDQVTLNKLTLPVYTYGKNSEGEIVVTKTTYVTKTAKEWLSDTENKDEYLIRLVEECFGSNGFPAYWGKGDSWEVKYTTAAGEEAKYTTAKDAFGKIVSKDALISAKASALKTASDNAFGPAANYADNAPADTDGWYLHAEPSVADFKYVASLKKSVGGYGNWILSKDEETAFVAKNYKAIITDLEAAIEFWTAAVEEWTANVEAYGEEVKAATAVETAAKKALKEYTDAITKEYNTTVAALNAKLSSLSAVKGALINAVDTYLAETYSGEENFMDWLATQVKAYEAKVIDLEYAVAKAEADLKAAEEGHFLTADNVARIQSELADLEEKLAGIVAQLEEAVAALATAQEIWAE